MNQTENLKETRIKKLQKIKENNINPYPYNFDKKFTISELLKQKEELEKETTPVAVAGRLIALRSQGKASFVDLWEAHSKIQLYITEKNIESYETIFQNLDIGDYIGVKGELFTTRMGEVTLRVKEIIILAKSILSFPVPKEKEIKGKKIIYDEFKDQETRYRKRYLDLILNQNSFQVFKNRSKIVKSIRDYLDNQGFIDVETPTLQSIYGGANATPFVTHHNALGLKLYLRISNELFLKKCIIAGFPKVYEIVKDFRNEGIDRTHNPEFTMLEFQEAFADYKDMMIHFENIYKEACIQVHQKEQFEFQGTLIDLSKDWERLPMKEAILKYAKIDVDKKSDDELLALLNQQSISLEGEYNRGLAIQEIFDFFCTAKLIQPVFIMDHPKETTALCKVHRKDKDLIERFEPYIMGWELGNCYTELNDPEIQREAFLKEGNRKKEGLEETHPMDESFIEAMEYGMPPTGGFGLGIDRMVMLFTNQKNIRDVILFPILK